MSLRSARRHPYPFHLRLGSILSASTERQGYMLIPNQDGLLVGRKQQMLDSVVPSVQEYGSAPVYRERTFTARPTGGYGERVQSSYGDRRYYWGMDIQVDGGLFGKGPLLHQVVPTSAAGGGVAKFLDVPTPAAGVFAQVILAGTKVYVRSDDTGPGQTVSHDFTPALVIDGVVYQGGFAGASPSGYVTTSTGQLWERNQAGTWAQATLPTGMLAHHVEVVGVELWIADSVASVIRKSTSDPKVAGSWSGPIFVGDPSVRITALRQTGNQLVVFKADGTLFTINADATVNDLFPGLTGPVNPDNGATAAAWLNSIWFRSGPSFYRLDMPGANLTAMGPGKLLENASPVRGDPRAFVGWGGYRAYLVLYNPLDTNSYLLSYGNWEPHDTQEGTQYTFDDQFDGALAHWNGRMATALGVSGVTGDQRLYIGFSDGGWDYFKLVQRPLATGSGAEFTVGPSEMVFPLHHAMFAADLKHWLGFSIFGPILRPGDEATLWYRVMASAGGPPTDPTGSWLLLGKFVANGQRIETPPNLAGNALQLKVALANTNQDTTPVIEIVAYHERVVPAFKRDLQMSVDARGFSPRLDGAVYRPNQDTVHKQMMQFAATPGSLAIELPDETVNEVAVFGYQERMLPMQAGGGRGWAIDIQATQFRILTVYGIIGRLKGTRIGDLKGYTIGSLKYL